jgi:hypothetical protein
MLPEGGATRTYATSVPGAAESKNYQLNQWVETNLRRLRKNEIAKKPANSGFWTENQATFDPNKNKYL